jgi:hypothetical protein
MDLNGFINQNHENFFYEKANEFEKESIDLSNKGEHIKSWGVSFMARLPYIADVIVNIVAAPLFLVATIFSLIPAIITWGEKTTLLKTCGTKFIEKVNHFCLSFFGAVISPWVAHNFRDANVAFGGLVFMGAVANEFSKRTVFAINLN